MAKPVESVGSDRGELKRLLKMAVDKPIPMAFALGADGKAIVKLDKIKQGRSLERGLKEDAAGSRNHRFGSVVVDPENPGVAKFIVNKQVTGIVRKLVIALKGTGYKKVVVVDEDGGALEEHEEEDEGDAEGEVRPSFQPTGDAEDATSRTKQDGGEAPAPDASASEARASEAAAPDAQMPEGSSPAGLDDAASLTRQLAAHVKTMLKVIARDPRQKSALAELATDAQLNLKRGMLGEAAAGVQLLGMAIASAAEELPPETQGPATPAALATPAPATPAAPPDPASTTRLRKSRMAWTATRAKVDESLDKLSQAIVQAGEGEDLGGNLEDLFYGAVSPALEALDGSLGDALARAADAVGEERTAALAEVRGAITDYLRFVQGSTVIRQLDGNPFVPVNLAKTLTATLDTLSRSVG